jgi:hypothetical protein
MQRIDTALRAAGVDPERPSHRDLWPFVPLHSGGIVATHEHAERARIQAGMFSISVAASVARRAISRRNAVAGWRRSTSRRTALHVALSHAPLSLHRLVFRSNR